MRGCCEEKTCQTEEGAGYDYFQQEDDRQGWGREFDMIVGMMNTPGRTGHIRQDTGDEAGEEGLMADPACHQDFQGEDGARDRRAEYSAKASGDTGHQKNAEIFFGQFTDPAEEAGHAAPDLHRGTLATGRSAKEMGDDGGRQYQGRHPRRHSATWLMDLVYDKVISCSAILTQKGIKGPDQQTCQGQKE
jgi:hypothetical protein